MIKLDAPIIPNEGVANVKIGDSFSIILEQTSCKFDRVGAGKQDVYRSENISFWVDNDLITQIMVRSEYTGRLEGGIGIGSKLRDAEIIFGSTSLDDEDNLVFSKLRGICIEIDVLSSPSIISEIYVYEENKSR